MKYIFYTITIILLLAVNAGVFSQLRIVTSVPNLLFLLLVVSALEKNSYDFFFIGLIAGLFLDFFSANFVGGFTFAFIFLGFILHQLVHNIITFEINWKYWCIILLLCLMFVHTFLWGYSALVFKLGWSKDFISFKYLEQKFILDYLYNLLLLYPVKRIFDGLKFIDAKYFSRQRAM